MPPTQTDQRAAKCCSKLSRGLAGSPGFTGSPVAASTGEEASVTASVLLLAPRFHGFCHGIDRVFRRESRGLPGPGLQDLLGLLGRYQRRGCVRLCVAAAGRKASMRWSSSLRAASSVSEPCLDAAGAGKGGEGEDEGDEREQFEHEVPACHRGI